MSTESVILLVALVFVLVLVLFVGLVLFGQYKVSPKNIKEASVIRSKNNKTHFESPVFEDHSNEVKQTKKIGVDNIVHWNEKIMMDFIEEIGGEKTAENVSNSLIRCISEVLDSASVSNTDRIDVFCSKVLADILMSNSSFDEDLFTFDIPKKEGNINSNLDISPEYDLRADVFVNKKFVGSVLVS
jgi:hypothetical protein